MTTIRNPRMLAPVVLALAVRSLVWAGDATDQIRQTTETILSIIQDSALKEAGREEERRQRMREVVAQRFDWAAIARSSMGRHWRDLSEAQRTEFTGVFSDLIEKTYMSKVESYSGETMLYKGDQVDGRYGVVDVVVVTLRGTNIPVRYRVLSKGEKWLVYDVSIEGVSLVNNYRSQIAAILNRSSFDDLIGRLRIRIAANAAGPAERTDGAAASSDPRKDDL